MKTTNFLILILLSSTIYLSSCKKDKIKPGGTIHHEEELITSVEVILQDSLGGGIVDTFAFRDIDGLGGMPPIIDTIHLNSNSTYFVELRFLDESNPGDVEDITAEIEMEDDEHIICYEIISIVGLNIQRTDSDGNYEVGLKSTWDILSTANSNSGTLKIQLKHQPDSKNGTCEPGDTDVLVEFPVIIN